MKAHALPEARWPTAAEAERSLLFSPVRIGRSLVLRNRGWVPAMVPWRATGDGMVTPEVLSWYERFARGRPGALVVEAIGIRDVPSGPLLRIGDDRFIPGLARLVETVRAASGGATRLFIQVIDFLTIRRRPTPEAYFGRHLAVTEAHRRALARERGDPAWLTAAEAAVRAELLRLGPGSWPRILEARELESLERGYRERVTDLHLPHVRNLPEVLPGLFADAAARARAAGFDGVELHFAHAYTMASFLSRLNDRDDGYGGSPEGRVRLGVEVIRAVRRRVGEDWPCGVRFLGDEAIAGGTRIDEACSFAVAFARAGAGWLSVSKGGKFEDAKPPRIGEAAYPYTGRSGLECMPTVRIDARGPFGRNLPLSAAVRAAVRAAGFPVPVVASGGLCAFDQIEECLRRGEADIAGAARQSLADPDWWLKMELGLGSGIRRCTYTNYCEGLDQRHKQVTCKLWDRDFRDGSAPRTADGRRRLVAPPWNPPETAGNPGPRRT